MKLKKVLAVLLAVACVMPAALLTGCMGSGNDEENTGGSGKNKTYVLEAEYTDVEGKQGASLSGEPFGFSLIYGSGSQDDKDKGWSNGYYIAHTYRDGFTIEFDFKAAASGTATIALRLGSELGTINLTPSAFSVVLNDQEVTYTSMQIQGTPGGASALNELKFYDKVLPGEVQLKEGDNTLKLIVKQNSLKPTAAGTKTTGGPLIDCVKITTKAGISWDPLTDNPERRDEVSV